MKKIYSLLAALLIGLSSLYAQTNGYYNVMKIPSLDSAPAYFYINTNIPASDAYAPQINITGYTYDATNKALKVTLSWYYYAGNFYWTQFQSDLGYQKPYRIRLGTYLKSGTNYIRIEIANNSIYWSNYNITATDRSDSFTVAYTGWTFAEGLMPTSTTSQITDVIQQKNVFIDGNVGIGTSSPDQKLTVNGTIHSKEVKVDTSIPVPDYVFDPDHKLPSLSETKAYVEKNRHLPEIPSAKQMEKEGISLGEMNMLLLKKVEELTLYLIEQQEVNRSLQNQIDRLTKKIK